MSAEPCAVGVDIGGQSVKLAIVDCKGAVHHRQQAAVSASWPTEKVTGLLVDQIGRMLADTQIENRPTTGVGVVLPGYMDHDRKRILFAANLPELNGSNLPAELAEAIEPPVIFDADCNAAALAEYRFGAGKGVDRLIVATVGTGIGAGVMIDGQIVRVSNHTAGSLGHVVVDAKGPMCSCGGRGCVEARASGRALEQLASKLARCEPASQLAALLAERGKLSGVEIAIALGDNDPAAHRAVRECGWWLGAGLKM